MSNSAVSLRDLLFVRDVLIPRAWVQGPEVDELVALRSRIDGIVAGLREPPPVEVQPETDPPPPEKPGKKARAPS